MYIFLSNSSFQGEIEGEEIELATVSVHRPQQGKARVSPLVSSLYKGKFRTEVLLFC